MTSLTPQTAEVEVVNGNTQGVSPKTVISGLLPLLAGVGLLVLDKFVFNDELPDEVWATLLATAPVVGAGAATAKTGTIHGAAPVVVSQSVGQPPLKDVNEP